MARNSPSEDGPRARLFLALDPDDATRAELANWRSRLVAGRDDVRPAPAATLHLTLAFLGSRREDEIEAIATAAFHAVAGLEAAELVPRGVVAVPRRGAPRLFALDLTDEDGRAARVQAGVADALARGGFYKPEQRPWWPHVTLARVRRGERADPLEETGMPKRLRAPHVTLYRSHLHPHGARYEALERMTI